MIKLARITSKRQLTLPIAVFEKAGFTDNSPVFVEVTRDGVLIKSATEFLDEIAGSVDVTKNL